MTDQSPATPPSCVNHADRPATLFCDRCGRGYCEDCVRVRDFGEFQAYICRACGDQCRPPAAPPKNPTRSFLNELTHTLSYPLRGKGLYVLIGGTIFFTFMRWLLGTPVIILDIGTAMIFGLLQFILACIFGGYFFAYAFRVVGSTAGGEDEPPDWPDFGDFWDFMRCLGLVLATLAVCFLPASLYVVAMMNGYVEGAAGFWVAFALGLFFLPMALLSVILYDSLVALNPVHLFRSIVRVGPAYLAAIGVLGVVAAIAHLTLVLNVVNVPILGTLVGVGAALYCTMAAMRVIGLLYASYEDRLRWFTP